MNLSIITNRILLNIKDELEKVENIEIIKKDILGPMIKHTINELYPYFFKAMIIIIITLLFLMITIFLNLRVIFKNY